MVINGSLGIKLMKRWHDWTNTALCGELWLILDRLRRQKEVGPEVFSSVTCRCALIR
jgi:hypothetical protein